MSSPHERYMAAAHAVQSGVAAEMQLPGYAAANPKQLRVGLDLSKAEQGGLARLLIAKGVFTEAEYVEAMAAAAEDEKATYERRLSDHYGTKITLA